MELDQDTVPIASAVVRFDILMDIDSHEQPNPCHAMTSAQRKATAHAIIPARFAAQKTATVVLQTRQGRC